MRKNNSNYELKNATNTVIYKVFPEYTNLTWISAKRTLIILLLTGVITVTVKPCHLFNHF